MVLSAGVHLGPYEIVAPLGAGGMGEVYRARDIKLHRDVAIKVLPEAVSSDPDRLARFEREAQVLAALNHPNIAAVYAVEDRAIVMELVAGEDLSARTKRGPIPLAEALPLARQIADALAAAHEAGIIHRDLKPANIKVTDDGVVKVLDFGLAKAFAPDDTSATADDVNSPTVSAPFGGAHATRTGVILGTAAYMAPEQARGKAVDKRADIWAFGVVLYEMLTGKRLFAADEVSDTLAHVLTKEPDWTALPATTPSRIRELLRHCLTKDAKLRLHDIVDARLQIDEAIAPGADGTSGIETGTSRTTAVSRWRLAAVAAAMFLLGGLAVGAGVWRLKPAATAPVAYVALDLMPAEELNSGVIGTQVAPAGGARTSLAWSPNGRTLAFVGREGGVRQLYLRDLGSDAARPLAGTEGGANPAFSPDGQWIAFSVTNSVTNTIRKVAVAGGPAAKICDVEGDTVNGITWGSARIIYAGWRQLFQVSPGAAEAPGPLTTPKPEIVRHASPHLLPGDAAVLYTEHTKRWTSGDERVMVKTLPDGVPKELLSEAADARYLPTGQLLFFRQGTAWVAPFNAKTFELGDQTPVLTGVAQAVVAGYDTDLTLAAQLAVSSNGTVAYVASPPVSYPDTELVSVDRKGHVTPLGYRAGPYQVSAASADGGSIFVTENSNTEMRPSVYDLARHMLTPLVPSGKREFAECSRSLEANLIACVVFDAGTSQLVTFRPGGASPLEVGVPGADGFWPSSWSRDGRHVAGTRHNGHDVWVFSPNDEPRWAPFLETKATEQNPAWSPDGRWLAYGSNATGRFEVWVKPYPGPGDEKRVSVNGGNFPVWNPAGKELFFAALNSEGGDRDRVMMAVNMSDPLNPGTPQRLFPFSTNELGFLCVPSNCYAVGPTGQQFFTTRTLPRTPRPVTQIRLIFNWFEELKVKGR